jgi:aminoglycoside phosphotransferase (APT) family kinase protein
MQLVRQHLGAVGGLVADAVVLDDATGCMAHRRVPGVPLQDLVATGEIDTADLRRLAAEIGGVIGAIAAIDPTAAAEPIPVDDAGADAWLEELPAALDVIGGRLTAEERNAVERFISGPPPPTAATDELVLAHNDLGAEHVLVDPTTLAMTGIIDWSDAAVADPAAELGRLLRDLGAAHLDAVMAGLAVTPARGQAMRDRAWWYARCLVVEDLAYAVRRRPDLIAAELVSLRALYAGA